MQEYEKIDISVIVFENGDIITDSKDDVADDFGQWNDGWLSKNNR